MVQICFLSLDVLLNLNRGRITKDEKLLAEIQSIYSILDRPDLLNSPPIPDRADGYDTLWLVVNFSVLVGKIGIELMLIQFNAELSHLSSFFEFICTKQNLIY